MTPPQLAGNAPILNVTHPSEIKVLILLWHEADAPVLHSLDGGFGQHFGIDIPLVCQPRLHHHARAVTSRHLQGVRFNLFQQAQTIQLRDDHFPSIEAIQTGIGGGSHFTMGSRIAFEGQHGELMQNASVTIQYIEQWQIMAFAHFIIVEVMGRRDFYASRAELGVHVVVGNNGYFPSGNGQVNGFANQMLVTTILGVYRHSGVA